MADAETGRIARPRWRDLALVCRRCAKRAGAKRFRSELKAAVKEAGGRRVRVVETGCLALCPKGAVAVATSATLARGEVRLLRPGGAAIRALAAEIAGTGDR